MATEKIVFEVEAKTGNSAASVKSVKAELRALQNEMAGLQVGSDAFVKAAQKAGQLKDQIEDANMAVKAFNPEAKFQAFAGVLGGVANGFSAVQGAMALFDTENKDVEKAILKTQGAIAIATGVNGLMGMKDAFIILGNVIKTQVVAAFATMRAAIISTGILGLVVLIGTLIYSWMEEADANEKATEALKKYGEENERIQKEVTKTAIAGMKGRQKEMTELQDKFNQDIVALYKDENKTLREKNAIALELNKQLEYEQQALKDKYREEDLKKKKEANDKEKERLKANKKSNDEYAKLADERFTKDMYAQIDAEKQLADMTEQFKRKEFEDSMARYDAEQASLKSAMDLDKVRTAARLANISAVSDALSGLGQLIGEETAAGKSLAVAQATIDTYVGATKAYAQGGVLGFISAAAVVAAGLANVRKIVSTKIPGQSSGGTSVSITAPQAPQFNPALATQVQGGGDVTLGAKPIPQKVYVVESDIRTVQNKVSVIENNSKIG